MLRKATSLPRGMRRLRLPTMIPRGTPDIDWADLGCALAACLGTEDSAKLNERVESIWGQPQKTLVCLSVRSGFDLFLQAAGWPPGSEILTSAVTIHDMARIIRHHQLTPVPLDICPRTLAVDPAQLAEKITPRTKAVLLAHLFGSRLNLDALLAAAHARGVMVIEDCAQAYDGTFRGHVASDVRMFSFGPIKTATALGGALLHVADASILGRMRALQARYASQNRGRFMRRVLQTAAIKWIARPIVFGAFALACKQLGTDHNRVLRRAMRGFPGDDLIRQIRRAPSAPLLRLLQRRLTASISKRIDRRIALAEKVILNLNDIDRPGRLVRDHSHWVLPINSRDPRELVRFLWTRGFDATRSASSLEAVAAPCDRPDTAPQRAAEMLSSVVYLPVYRKQSQRQLAELVGSIEEFENGLDTNP